VTSAWTAPPASAERLVSKDGKAGLVVAGISGGESAAQAAAQALSDEVARDHPVGATGVIVRSGGAVMVNAQINSQLQRDLLLMESIAVPLSFLVLVWVFGGLLAAALPVAVGLLAILGSMAVLRFITFSTDVSNLAPNLSTAMGLALAIDYTLLIISRYRDELAEGADPNTALIRTMTTAGRTVLVSATTVALSMSAMILFPMHVLKSFAYAGVATVAFAALAAVVVTPAALVLLGDRLNALDVRRLARRLLHRPEPVRGPIERQFWYGRRRPSCAVPRRSAAVVALVRGRRTLLSEVGFPMTGCCRRRCRRIRSATSCAMTSRRQSATAVTAVIPTPMASHRSTWSATLPSCRASQTFRRCRR
jgi:RND superfamily putative drug exporter